MDNTPRRRSKARGASSLSGPGGERPHVGSVSSSDSATQGILQLEKVDVYGFGVVLLELITGQKAMKEVHITSVVRTVTSVVLCGTAFYRLYST